MLVVATFGTAHATDRLILANRMSVECWSITKNNSISGLSSTINGELL
jgi:hypothetical protein